MIEEDMQVVQLTKMKQD
jgi:Trichohyalin-plectin-homology domain